MTEQKSVDTERLGAEMAPPVYKGPVKLVSYEYRECHGHVYMVDDPGKLPENAVGVRVPNEHQLQQFLFYAYTKGIKIYVAPGHRYWWEGGKLLWTIHAAKT